MRPQSITLNELRVRYENNKRNISLQSLFERHRIVLDSECVYHSDSEDLSWSSSSHFLDFRMIMSKDVGLDGVLPQSRINHNWSLSLTFREHFREWRTSYSQLGFDVSGSMLYIGRCGQEELWLGFAPIGFVRGDGTHVFSEQERRKRKGSTQLSTERYRQFCSLGAAILDEMGFGSIYSNTAYPDITTLVQMEATTNIM